MPNNFYPNTNTERRLSGIWLLSMTAPVVVLTIVFIIAGIAPFGDTLLKWQGTERWYSLFSVYHDTLMGGGSLYYSFSSGLGGQQLSAMRDGMYSPFMLIAMFFTSDRLPECFAIIMLVRSALAGLFSYTLLKTLCGDRPFIAAAFSTAYSAGSLFTLGLLAPQLCDAAVFLPLVAAGVALLAQRGSVILLFLGMVFFLLTSGTMWVCMAIFVLMFFIWSLMVFGREDTVRKTGLLLFCSALAAGVDTVLLIPALISDIEQGSVIYSSGVVDHASVLTLLEGMYSGTAVSSDGSYAVLLCFCSTLTLLLFPLYLLGRKQEQSERRTAGLFMLMLILCAAVPSLTAVLSGFVRPNGYVVAFGCCIALLGVSCSVRLLSGVGIRPTGISTGIVAIVWLLSMVVYLFTILIDSGSFVTEGIIFTLVFITLFAALTLLIFSGRRLSGGFYLLLLLLICSEGIVSGSIALRSGAVRLPLYSKQTVAAEYAEQNNLRGIINTNEQQTGNISSYRIRGAVIPGQNSLSAPSDSTPSAKQLMTALGVADISSGTPITDSLLGVRYIASSQNDLGYKPLSRTESNIIHYNDKAMKLGYPAANTVLIMDSFGADPFMAQNMLITAIAGAQRELFVTAPIGGGAGKGCVAGNTLSGTEIIRSEDNAYMVYTVSTAAEGTLYMYLNGDHNVTENVAVNGNQIGSFRLGEAVRLGEFDKGERVQVYISVTGERLVLEGMYFASLSRALTDAALNELCSRQCAVSVRGNTLSANVLLEDGQIFMTTIPWQNGWSATVDGQPYPTSCAVGALLAVDCGAGAHDITLTYRPNDGIAATLISIFSLIFGMIFTFAVELGRRRREAELSGYDYPTEMPYPDVPEVIPQPPISLNQLITDYQPRPEYEETYVESYSTPDTPEIAADDEDIIPELVGDIEPPTDEYGYIDENDDYEDYD